MGNELSVARKQISPQLGNQLQAKQRWGDNCRPTFVSFTQSNTGSGYRRPPPCPPRLAVAGAVLAAGAVTQRHVRTQVVTHAIAIRIDKGPIGVLAEAHASCALLPTAAHLAAAAVARP